MFQFPRLALSIGDDTAYGAGLPHSGIAGSQVAYTSPALFVVGHALHRPSAPRHPPCALKSFIPLNQRSGDRLRFTATACAVHILLSRCLSRAPQRLPQTCSEPTWLDGDDRARTGDLLRARQPLSQLSYIPRVQ